MPPWCRVVTVCSEISHGHAAASRVRDANGPEDRMNEPGGCAQPIGGRGYRFSCRKRCRMNGRRRVLSGEGPPGRGHAPRRAQAR